MSGGSSEIELKELAVKPTKASSDARAVMTVTPGTGPQSAETADLVPRLRHEVLPPVERGTGVDALVTGLPAAGEDFRVFHSGTALRGGAIVTNGGRVLCATALGDSIKMAQRRAYEIVEGIRFDGMQYRRDIGHRAVAPRRL